MFTLNFKFPYAFLVTPSVEQQRVLFKLRRHFYETYGSHHILFCILCFIVSKMEAKWEVPTRKTEFYTQYTPKKCPAHTAKFGLKCVTFQWTDITSYRWKKVSFDLSNKIKCSSQNELDNLVRDLNLSKQALELFTSSLKICFPHTLIMFFFTLKEKSITKSFFRI